MNETNKTAAIVNDQSDVAFLQSAGISRRQASRIVAAQLGVLGAALPSELTPRQALTAAINVVGMLTAEIIATSSAEKPQRDELVNVVTEFIRKNVDTLAEEYERLARFQNLLRDTINEKGETKLAEGQLAN